jgi:hypothetical protein
MYKLKNNSKPLIWLMGLLLTAFIAGCGSGGDGGGMSTAQPGTLGVSLTDAPACGFDEVNVTVSKVRVHQSDTANENAAGWADIALNPPKKINLRPQRRSRAQNPWRDITDSRPLHATASRLDPQQSE